MNFNIITLHKQIMIKTITFTILLALLTLITLFLLIQIFFGWQIAAAFVGGCVITDLFWGLAMRKRLAKLDAQ